jgi:hypothetical protein
MLCCALQSPLRAAGGDLLEPDGIWGCLMYGHPRLGDERQLLRFRADGRTDTAHPRADGFRIWMPLTKWQAKRHRLSFSDPRTGREFVGDLRRTTLGGTWNTTSMNGGWWCAAVSEDPDLEQAFDSLQRSSTQDLMPPLVAHVLSTPSYPRQAIREGMEGRAVACFLVDSGGAIHDPDFVELSDEVFRATTLRALQASRYRAWIGATELRPGCRVFRYRLDTVYQ